MSLSKDEAEKALAEIGEARDRTDRTHSYSDAAPFFLLWGAIWLVCNLVAEFAPRFANTAWLVATILGMPISIVLVVGLARRWSARASLRKPSADQRKLGLRLALSELVVIGFMASVFVITSPLDGRQGNALISIFWAFVYMAAGVWIGWRLLIIGAVIAAAILFGYLALDQYYHLWIGTVAGGGLIAGGLWLRKI